MDKCVFMTIGNNSNPVTSVLNNKTYRKLPSCCKDCFCNAIISIFFAHALAASLLAHIIPTQFLIVQGTASHFMTTLCSAFMNELTSPVTSCEQYFVRQQARARREKPSSRAQTSCTSWGTWFLHSLPWQRLWSYGTLITFVCFKSWQYSLRSHFLSGFMWYVFYYSEKSRAAYWLRRCMIRRLQCITSAWEFYDAGIWTRNHKNPP